MGPDRHDSKRWTSVVAFVLIAFAILVTSLTAGPASAAPAASANAVTWSVASVATTFRPGESVPLEAVVTNRGLASCALPAGAAGTVHVIAATRDGTALTPSFSRELPVDGGSAILAPLMTTVAAGATVSFRLDAGGPQGLAVVTPRKDGSLVVASWPTSTPGTYRLTLAYQAPPLVGSAGCPSMTNAVTIGYVIAMSSPRIWWWWWFIAAVALLALSGTIAVALVLRRRRHTGGVTVTMVLLLAALGGVLVHAPAARANVVFNPGSDKARQKQYDGCEAEFTAFDPALWSDLNGPGKPLVTVYPWVYSSREDLKSGTPRDSFIRWDNQDRKHIPGDPAGVNYVPCAELYHELVHAQDAAKGNLSDRMCDDTGVLYDEVRATIAENLFRAKYGGAQRTTYDGHTIPSTLADCTPSTKPQPPAGRTRHCDVTRCAVTNGDPHLVTFDGARYDLQAVGEFTEVSATTGDLTVQVRQSAFAQTRSIAVNTAIALQVDATRLGFYLTDGLIAVHRGGAPVTFTDGKNQLPGGATVTSSEDPYGGAQYDVRWLDGTVVSIFQAGAWGLVATVTPALVRKGTLTGLLGTFDGDPANDVAPPGGPPLVQPPTFDALYPAFADSWRITDADSLFDYVAGQNTATFTDRTFPSRPATATGLTGAQRTAAAVACQITGVVNTADIDGCVLDVAVTGQADFALSAADIQDAGMSSGTATTPTETTLAAAITQPGGTARVTFTGIKGQRVYVQMVATTLAARCGLLTLYAPDGTILTGGGCTGSASYIDGTLMPVDGRYTVAVGPSATIGTITLRFISTQDQMITAAIDGPAVTAAITAPGAQTRITFSGIRGHEVFITASGVTLPSECGVIRLVAPDGKELAVGCLAALAGFIDATTLPSTGQYAILVDPDSDHTGQVGLRITSVVDQVRTTAIGAPPVVMTIAQPGAVARLTFTGTAGEKITVTATGSTLAADCQLLLLGPDQKTIDETCVDGSATIPAILPTTGQYTVLVDPNGDHVGEIDLAVTTS